MAAGDTYKLGPGTLNIGAVGAEIDVSCLVNNAVVSSSKDEGDAVTKLCGTVVPGAVTYSYSLAGNMDVDITDPAGIFALSQSDPGSQQEYEFTPSTEAGTSAKGTLVLDPLDFGGDTVGDTMASDFEFTLVGAPNYTYGTGADAVGDTPTEDTEAA